MNSRDEVIFGAATVLPLEQRAAYLEQACGADAQLRQRVESLLLAHEQAGAFMAEPAILLPAETIRTAVTVTEKPGDTIGHYKLLQQIGEGGCGVVYMAEQTEPIRRRVAFKVIKLGMDTRAVIARFEAERQALALMDHPNIARVLDAGATETGRPYFVMELVRGIRITDYCDQNNLSTEQRLNLFIQVCHAIQHAHQKGIIHRDIKPSNILVTVNDGVPVPKVIDFGIAKATGGQILTDKTLFTAFEQFIGTPAYMSPEQAEMTSLDIDTRSDVYALGVLLYELLTGQTPFDVKTLMSAGLEGMRRIIREKEPPRPSTRLSTLDDPERTTVAKRRQTEPPKLVHQLRGDLDWIVMKCLEKDRTRRYETANGLANDLQHHLSNEPVAARPPSTAYKLQKFAHRNRAAVAAAGIITASLLIGAVVSSWQAVRATRAERQQSQLRAVAEDQRKVAVEERSRAEAATKSAQENFQTAELNLYAADMTLAHRALDEGNLARTRQLLEAHRPGPGQPDFRGAEWRYLWTTSRGDQVATLTAGTNCPVLAVAVSRDGRLLAAGCADGRVLLWELSSLRLVRSLSAHRRECIGVDFSPDGRFLASCSSNAGDVKFWELESGKLTREIKWNRPFHVLFSPDGKVVAVSVGDRYDRSATVLLDPKSGEEPVQLPESDSMGLAFSRSGAFLATCPYRDGSLKFWDPVSRKMLRSLAASGFTVSFSPGDETLATREWGSLQLWRVADGTKRLSLPVLPPGNGRAVFSPDGKLLVANIGATIQLWDATTFEAVGQLHGHEGEVSELGFSPDGRLLVSGSADGTVRLWRAGPAVPRSRSVTIVGSRAWDLPQWPVSADGKWLAIRTSDYVSAVAIIEIEKCRVRCMLETAAFPLGFLSNSHTLVALSGARELDVRNLLAPKVERSAPWTNPPVRLELWNWESRTNWAISLNHLPMATCRAAALSADGAWLALGMGQTMVISTTIGEAKPVAVLEGEGSLAFSPDGRYLVTSSSAKASLWEWAKGKEVASWKGYQSSGTPNPRTVFSPDGKRLAITGSEPGRIHIREVPTGKLLFALSGPATTYVSFSQDGNTLAAGGSFGGNSTLWHLPTRREVMSFDNTRAMFFSPADRTLAAVDYEHVYLTPLPSLAEADAAREALPTSLEEVLHPPPGPPIEYLGKSGQPTQDHGASPLVRDFLWRGRGDCGAQQWQWASEWFAKALKEPDFDWRSAAKSDPEAVGWMPVAFVRAGDAAGYEALCRHLIESVDQSPDPAGAARTAAAACLLAPEPTPELLRRVEYLLKSISSAAPSTQFEPRFELLSGIFEYRRLNLKVAVEWLNGAAEGHDAWSKTSALLYHAICAQRLGAVSEAEQLWQQARSLLPGLVAQVKKVPQDAPNLETCLLALEEAEKLLGKVGNQRTPRWTMGTEGPVDAAGVGVKTEELPPQPGMSAGGRAVQPVRASGVLLNDAWPTGVRNEENLPSRSAWCASKYGAMECRPGALVFTLGEDSLLALTRFTTNRNHPVALEAGQRLSATFQLSLSRLAATGDGAGFRVGLFNFAESASQAWTLLGDGFSSSSMGERVAGYALFQDQGEAFGNRPPMQLRKRTRLEERSLMGTATAWNLLSEGPRTNTPPFFTNDATFALEFALQRTGTNSMQMTATWSNTLTGATLTTSATDTFATNFNFDGIALRFQKASQSAEKILFRQVKAEVAP